MWGMPKTSQYTSVPEYVSAQANVSSIMHFDETLTRLTISAWHGTIHPFLREFFLERHLPLMNSRHASPFFLQRNQTLKELNRRDATCRSQREELLLSKTHSRPTLQLHQKEAWQLS